MFKSGEKFRIVKKHIAGDLRGTTEITVTAKRYKEGRLYRFKNGTAYVIEKIEKQ